MAPRWDRTAAAWLGAGRQSLWRRHADAAVRPLIERWLPGEARRVLKTDLFEEACGAGQMDALAARGATVTGIDLSGVVVEAAAARHPRLNAHAADVRALPFTDSAFDAVVSLSTLDHFEEAADIPRALAELRRVSSPGATLVLTLDNPANPVVALRQTLPGRLTRKLGLVPYHCGPTLSPEGLAKAVEAAGFALRHRGFALHSPRVAAVALAGLLERLGSPPAERRYLALLACLERLERWPTRRRTGHFTAIVATAR